MFTARVLLATAVIAPTSLLAAPPTSAEPSQDSVAAPVTITATDVATTVANPTGHVDGRVLGYATLDSDPAGEGYNPVLLGTVNGKVVVRADGDGIGSEVFVVDGDGLALLADINSVGSSYPASTPTGMPTLGGLAHFVATDADLGPSVYATDGTTVTRVLTFDDPTDTAWVSLHGTPNRIWAQRELLSTPDTDEFIAYDGTTTTTVTLSSALTFDDRTVVPFGDDLLITIDGVVKRISTSGVTDLNVASAFDVIARPVVDGTDAYFVTEDAVLHYDGTTVTAHLLGVTPTIARILAVSTSNIYIIADDGGLNTELFVVQRTNPTVLTKVTVSGGAEPNALGSSVGFETSGASLGDVLLTSFRTGDGIWALHTVTGATATPAAGEVVDNSTLVVGNRAYGDPFTIVRHGNVVHVARQYPNSSGDAPGIREWDGTDLPVIWIAPIDTPDIIVTGSYSLNVIVDGADRYIAATSYIAPATLSHIVRVRAGNPTILTSPVTRWGNSSFYGPPEAGATYTTIIGAIDGHGHIGGTIDGVTGIHRLGDTSTTPVVTTDAPAGDGIPFDDHILYPVDPDNDGILDLRRFDGTTVTPLTLSGSYTYFSVCARADDVIHIVATEDNYDSALLTWDGTTLTEHAGSLEFVRCGRIAEIEGRTYLAGQTTATGFDNAILTWNGSDFDVVATAFNIVEALGDRLVVSHGVSDGVNTSVHLGILDPSTGVLTDLGMPDGFTDLSVVGYTGTIGSHVRAWATDTAGSARLLDITTSGLTVVDPGTGWTSTEVPSVIDLGETLVYAANRSIAVDDGTTVTPIDLPDHLNTLAWMSRWDERAVLGISGFGFQQMIEIDAEGVLTLHRATDSDPVEFVEPLTTLWADSSERDLTVLDGWAASYGQHAQFFGYQLVPLGYSPSSPRIVTATEAGASSVAVTWTTPRTIGDSAITGYTATVMSGTSAGATCTAGAAESTCTLTGVDTSGAYTVGVKAVNRFGGSRATTAPVAAGAGSGAGAGGATFVPLTPARVLDTRSGVGADAGRVGALDGSGTALTLQVTGRGGVPTTGVAAVALNVTVVDGLANDFGGYVTVYPCDVAKPDASNLNFVSGKTVPNSVIAPVSADGTVCLYVYGTAHLLVDVSGYFASGFSPLTPARVVDTRPGGVRVGELDGSGVALEVQVTGAGGVPASGVSAVALNVTVVDGLANDFGGYVTVYPCDVAKPDASNLNFVSGQTVPNSVIAPVSADGTVCLYVYGTAHLLVDVSGHM
ncbi:MAG: fibronectin type III domain-containing protein [Ilumatobacteraceae bacterium]